MRNPFYRLLPWLVLLLSLAVTFWSWRDARKENELVRALYFDRLYAQATSAIVDRIDTYSNAHYGGAALFRHSVVVTRREWRQFVESLDLERRHPGVTGVGYVGVVEAADIERFESEGRQIGYPDYRVRSSRANALLYPVKMIEPLERSSGILGLDLSDEIGPTEAMERARDRGTAQMSRRVLLIQEELQPAGFMIFLPLYGSNMPPAGVDERRRQHTGWIYASFTSQEFVEGLLDELLPIARSQISLGIYAGTEIVESDQLYLEAAAAAPIEPEVGPFRSEVFELLGQPWTMVARPGEGFATFVPPRDAPRVLVTGLLVSGAVFGSFLSMSRTRAKALGLAYGMTRDLELRTQELEASNRELAVAVETAKLAADTLLEQHDTLARTDRMAAVGEMAGGLAHEIRNPLAGIKMSLENLRADQGDPGVRERIDLPIRELDRLARLLNRYLSPLRHEPEPRTPVAMAGLVEDLCSLLQFRLPENVTLTHDVAEDFVWNLPRDRIRQTLLNLVLNAINAIGAETGVVTIRALRSGDRLVLGVEDDGPGFPEGFAEGPVRRFETRSDQGTGLGLAMVQRVAEDLAGRLVIERRETHGAWVWLDLPS